MGVWRRALQAEGRRFDTGHAHNLQKLCARSFVASCAGSRSDAAASARRGGLERTQRCVSSGM